MSLVAWYPLNGNLNDYTKNNGEIIEQANVKWDESGKIGKSYKAELANTFVRINNPLKLANKFTIAFWMKESTSSNWSDLFSFTNGVNSNSCRLEKTSEDGNYTWYMNGCFTSGTTLFTRTSNKWEHIVLTCDGTKVYCYKNGIETYSANVSSINYLPNLDYIHITKRDTGSYWNGNLNDFRIYDHALSLKEIKEIAKAKILHYKFDDMQEPSTNVAAGTLTNYAPYHTLERDGQNIKCVMTAAASQYLTINNGINYNGKIIAISGRCFKNGVPHRLPITRANTYHTVSAISYTFDSSTGGFEIIENCNASSIWIFHCPAGTIEGDVIEIKDFQVEVNDSCTPFMSQGTREGKVTDVSGYDYHSLPLDESTTPKWERNSKIGTGCYRYKDSKMQIQCSQPQMKFNQFSFSLWLNEHSYLGGYPLFKGASILFSLKETSVRVRCCNNTTWATEIVCETGARKGWHHFVYTFDNGIQKLYYDGKLLGTVAAGTTEMSWYGPSLLNLGYRYDGGVYPNLNASLDDLRLYATALSDSDVLNLCSSRIAINKQGTLFANQLSEKSFYNTIISSDNLLTNGFAELKDNTNFPGMTYCATDGYTNLGCFERAGAHTLQSSENIPINMDHTYEIGGYFKSVDPKKLSYGYMGMMCLDEDFKHIAHLEVNHYSKTRTTLAKAIVNGDTTITLTSAVDWTIGTNGVEHHTKHIGICNRPEATNYERNSSYTPYLSISGNILTLKAPWTKGTIPVGTKVANCYSGSGFEYVLGAGTIPATWTNYKATVSKSRFRFGTKYIKFLWLVNYNQDSTYKVRGADIYIKNVTSKQVNPTKLIKSEMHKSGTAKVKEFNEVGITYGLIAYYNGKNEKDYSGRKNHLAQYNTMPLPQFNSGMTFTGTEGARIDNILTPIRTENKDFSVAIKFNSTHIGKQQRLFMGFIQNYLELSIYNSKLRASIRNAEYRYVESASILEKGKDYFAVMMYTHKNRTLSLYLDDNAPVSITGITPFLYCEHIIIGNWIDGLQGLVGKIHYFKLFNRALTPSEIAIEYKTTALNQVLINKDGTVYANSFNETLI